MSHPEKEYFSAEIPKEQEYVADLKVKVKSVLTHLKESNPGENEKRRKKIICVAGLPGVGKSTIAEIITAGNVGEVINVDNLKRVVYEKHPELDPAKPDSPEIRWEYYKLAADQAATSMTDVVVIDEVFPIGALREKLEERLKDMGVEVEWVHVKCPPEVIKRRLESTGDREGHILSAAETLKLNEAFSKIFEEFPPEKQVVVINNYND